MPVSAPSTDKPIAACSFCGKPNTVVQALVAGPGVFICNECVDLSAAVVAQRRHPAAEESARLRAEFGNRSAEEILGMLPAAARVAAQTETQLARWIGRLRDLGIDWPQIAGALGTDVGTARQRFEPGRPA